MAGHSAVEDAGRRLSAGAAMLDGTYVGFSYPQPGHVADLDVLVPTIALEYAAALTDAWLDKYESVVEARSEGLVSFLRGWTEEPLIAESAGWDVTFGNLYRTLGDADLDVAWLAAAVAAHLGVHGAAGAWSVELDALERLRWGPWLLPAAAHLEVESGGTAARVACGHRAEAVELQLAGDSWTSSAGDLLPHVERHGVTFDVLLRDGLCLRDFDHLVERAVPSLDPRMLDVFLAALDIIDQYAPQYVPWVRRTLHQLFLITPASHTIESGSVEHYLGLVHLSAHGDPLPVAELLAHEATHQYMNVLAKLAPLDDGTDERAYWSPPVNAYRPLAKIVAAYHAFGNVALFYRSCAERDLPNQAECERQQRLMSEWLEVLGPPLDGNSSLSATGRALCEPLTDVLRP